ncbi:hypothetical protein DENSPDRAFT_216973 [Dentipellis sp. KUC8613]|nr:hypothetical protein DENSPDRAFT_216973 [Dentipellis sp. KUC8613]
MLSTSGPPGIDGEFTEVTRGGDDKWLPYKTKRLYTNAFIIHGNKLLLGYKKRGFGVGKYNGFGGKVEPGETPDQAAARELEEEAGIEAPLEHSGTFLFVTEGGPDWAFQIEIYRAEEYSGTLAETDEMRPVWFSISASSETAKAAVASVIEKAIDNNLPPIPYESMWDSDYLWLPLLLSKTHFVGRTDFKEVDGVFKLERWWFGVPPSTDI